MKHACPAHLFFFRLILYSVESYIHAEAEAQVRRKMNGIDLRIYTRVVFTHVVCSLCVCVFQLCHASCLYLFIYYF